MLMTLVYKLFALQMAHLIVPFLWGLLSVSLWLLITRRRKSS